MNRYHEHCHSMVNIVTSTFFCAAWVFLFSRCCCFICVFTVDFKYCGVVPFIQELFLRRSTLSAHCDQPESLHTLFEFSCSFYCRRSSNADNDRIHRFEISWRNWNERDTNSSYNESNRCLYSCCCWQMYWLMKNKKRLTVFDFQSVFSVHCKKWIGNFEYFYFRTWWHTNELFSYSFSCRSIQGLLKS